MALKHSHVLLCLGSGLTPRYRLNTLQALALPTGSRLQFRYSDRLIPEGVRDRLNTGALVGATALLGHVDCTERGRLQDGRCLVEPYREARVVDAKRFGTTFVLNFELGAFRRASDLEAFQRSLPSNSPRWRLDPGGDPVRDTKGHVEFEGAWCQELSGDHQTTTANHTIDTWQAIVHQLRQCPDFETQPFFYVVESLSTRGTARRRSRRLTPVEGEYHLESGQDYVLSVFHYDPDSDAHMGNKVSERLQLDASNPPLLLRSSPQLRVDSPYDLKTIHFSTADSYRTQHGSLYLYAPAGDIPENAERVPSLFFAVSVEGRTLRTLLSGLLLGALLTGSQAVSILSKGTFPGWELSIAAATGLGFLTGLFAAFGLRKPI